MASPLAAVERFFERLFERPAARLFQARVETVNIQRALERVIETERRVRSKRVYVPSHFRVLLNSTDLAGLDGDRALASRQLSDGVRDYARAHGYVLLARPRVTIDASAVVQPGDVRAFAESWSDASATNGSSDQSGGQPHRSNGSGELPAAGDEGTAPSDGAGTAVYAIPRPNAPRASLAVRMPGRPVTRMPVTAGTIRLGRARDNDIVLVDDGVSRHHGQIGARLGMLVYTDLGSSNGSFLNGGAVTEIALGPGDVLQLGSSTVTIEPSP
jgi:hypothetical protein